MFRGWEIYFKKCTVYIKKFKKSKFKNKIEIG